jgi:hypothetical protein
MEMQELYHTFYDQLLRHRLRLAKSFRMTELNIIKYQKFDNEFQPRNNDSCTYDGYLNSHLSDRVKHLYTINTYILQTLIYEI